MERVNACSICLMTVVTGVIVALGIPAPAVCEEENEALGQVKCLLCDALVASRPPADESIEDVFVETFGTYLGRSLKPELKIGERTPNIAAWTLSGDVYDYQPPDRTVLLCFWSMKEPSYTSHYEHLSRIRTEFAGVPNFLMISVLIDEDRWDAFSEYCVRQGRVKYGSGKPIRFLDDPRWWQLIVMENQTGESMLKKYGIESTPQSFLLGPRGVLIESRIPFNEIREVVAKHVTSDAKEQLPGTRDEVTLNGATFAFRFCPPGDFWMGSNEEARARYEEKFVPRHHVRLTRGFWMQETEVTQSQYFAIMGAKPSFWRGRLTATGGANGKHPVERVSWVDAKTFCSKLSALDPRAHYRLPTEAEWEYACRAGTTGPTYGKLEDIAWYFENTGVGDGTGSHGHRPVRSKTPNAWGLYDMLGNVEEWCSSWSGPPAANETTDPTGPLTGRARVVRGSSCLSGRYLPGLMAGYRSGQCPKVTDRTIGFRVVRLPLDSDASPY